MRKHRGDAIGKRLVRVGADHVEDELGGGKVASVGKAIATELSYLQFPPAAANAMVLLLIVILMIVALGRIVDVRREL